LAALAIRPNEVVAAETLFDEVWPGVPDDVARRRLQTAVWKLRSTLRTAGLDGPACVRWCAPGYVLDVADDQLDWTRFRRLRVAGEQALQSGAPDLAKSYLSAALALWDGIEPLSGIDVAADDLAFIATRRAGRERAARSLVDAKFELGEYALLTAQLEPYLDRDPLDESAVCQLAASYHHLGNTARALATCGRYLAAAEQAGVAPSARVTDLQSAILRRDRIDSALPGREQRAIGRGGGADVLCSRAFLSAVWEPFDPSPAGPVPAELHLTVEEGGGRIRDATEYSIDASFSEVRPALRAAVELQEALGSSPHARAGVHVLVEPGPQVEESTEAFEGPPRARARLLASAAREGQILVSGATEGFLRDHMCEDAGLLPMGTHRLNTLTPPMTLFQLTGASVGSSDAPPRWFDESPVRNLAIDPYRLVGREREVAEVTELLEQSRFVTLTGAPGSGKTRLAAHVATGLSKQYRDGAWFVDLRALSEGDLVAVAVADALRVPRRGPPLDALLWYLRERHVLLLLDNCEHLLSGCQQLVEGLLPACPWVTVLATSREPLGSGFEHMVYVRPLEPPRPAVTDGLLANPSVQLVFDRLGTDEARDAHAVARICRAVEGLPLALVLATARADELGTAALAGRLETALGEGRGLEVLSGAEAGADPRTTLTGTIEWSYRLLDARDQLLFDALSVFRGAFTVEDVAAVCVSDEHGSADDVRTSMKRLVRASMVATENVDPGVRRFQLLQAVREYASAKLATQPTRATELGRRHATHFLAVSEDAEPRVRGPQDRATLDRLQACLPDFYAAIRWAISNGEPLLALRLAGSLWVFWLVQGRIAEGRQMLAVALAGDASPSVDRIRALVAYSCLSWFEGDLETARDVCRDTLTDAAAIGDDWGWAWAATGFTAVGMFDTNDESIPLRLEEALSLFRRLGNTWDTALALQTLGGAAWHRSQYERAEQAFAEAIELLQSIGHPTAMASRADRGLMLALLGDLGAGAGEIELATVAAYEAGDLAGLAHALCERGTVARYGGHHEQARSFFRDALHTAHEAGDAWSLQWALAGLASMDDVGRRPPRERVEGSVELLGAADALSRATGIVLAPREREARDRDLEAARARLGRAAFEAAFERGQLLGPDDAIDLALSSSDARPGKQ
jgi:predicted ATPase/DNA-binding SARP family transcriptional activator